MLDSIKKKQISAVMGKHFILMNLIFPLYSSSVGQAYSPDIVYANLFAVMFVGLACLEGNIEWKRRSWLGYAVAFFLLCFNVFAFYVNKNFFGWYYGQVNMTIAFVFFLAWLFMKEDAACMGEDMVKFLLKAALITNAIGLIPSFLGFQHVWVSADGYAFLPKDAWEPRYAWIFSHKSEYSFMLVLFLALSVVYRELYDKKWQFWASVAVYGVGLVIADTRATMMAAVFILAGAVMDSLIKKAGGFKWRYIAGIVPVIVVGLVVLLISMKDRNVFTLNGRLYIWKGAVKHILDNPWGIGSMCGIQDVPVEFGSGNFGSVRNCHNVFLNWLLQYSIPAGFFCIAMMGAIIVASIKKNPSFLTLGIWAALLIPMNMDWCVLLAQIPMMLLVLYFVFFRPKKRIEE